MSFIPDNDAKDRVKQATEIVQLIGSHLNLRRQGSGYVGHCPWHDDSRPSLQVNPAKQTYVCWVCDIRGDVFDFVMRYEKVNFREALEILAEEANIPLGTPKQPVAIGSAQDKQTLYRAMAWAEQEYHQFLLHAAAAEPAREYLLNRGISQESIRKFRLGFAPLSWNWLSDRAEKTSFDNQILEACDLVATNNRGGWYDRFRARVLFPIRDTQDRPIGMGGRV
ncbi:MAG: CHC2 zinc finger domain-containing protein, partial [Planctomycetota bacterium]